MHQIFKNIGKGTMYEFNRFKVYTPLPSRDGKILSKPTMLDNEWYDKCGNEYKITEKYLLITAKDFFSNDRYSIIDYINEIPKEINLTVILKVKARANDMAGFNMLCGLLSTINTSRKIILDITNLEFCEKVSLEFEKLPNNVKITSLLDRNYNENYAFSNQSFESWMLNCDNEKFQLLSSKLTPVTYTRLYKMRNICMNFYRYVPDDIKSMDLKTKALFAYKWCCDNIGYDYSATKLDGSLKDDRKDSQDPIITFERRKGVCEGRARLLKLLLNNYYMKVPCFLVKGISGRLQHTWNEILLEQDIIMDLDISKQTNRISDNHNELSMYISIPTINQLVF